MRSRTEDAAETRREGGECRKNKAGKPLGIVTVGTGRGREGMERRAGKSQM